ncbi:MAG: hypothetical protein HYV40_02895 [Candidatus Levybacteria bacterium]|nr:hypothetical protein [Candidatus Levybacteria bacterium]
MLDGTPRQPISPQEAGFQAPKPSDITLPRADIILPPTVPQTALDIWGPPAIRIHRVDGEGENARGFLTVTPELVRWARSVPTLDTFQNGVGSFTADLQTTGHFDGLLQEFKPTPGHYSERAGVTTAVLSAYNLTLEEFRQKYDVFVVSSETVNFEGVVRKGDTAEFTAETQGAGVDGVYADIKGKRGGQDVISMKRVRFERVPKNEEVLPFDEIDEAAIQFIATAAMGTGGLPVDAEGKPLKVGVFKKIAGAEYYRPVRVGDVLQIIPQGLQIRPMGDVVIVASGATVLNQRDELVTSYKRTQAGLIPFEQAQTLFAA